MWVKAPSLLLWSHHSLQNTPKLLPLFLGGQQPLLPVRSQLAIIPI